ncbi:MAG: (Fe-S)-binding protein [Candidatus Thorarchaeota archaeon]|jgi:heterodisulfide reductase subunit D
MSVIDIEDLVENLMQCRRCGICRNAVFEDRGFEGVCPVWKTSSGFETSFMRGRIQIALALLDGGLEKTPENAEALYTCTLCGSCTEICAAEFDPAECLEKVRDVLNEIPNEARDEIARNILKNNNPYVKDNSTKRDWVQELGLEVPTTGNILYYTGCTAGLKLPSIVKSTAKILKAAKIEFAVLEDEPCCGSVMLRTGKRDDAKKNAQRVANAITASKASKVLVTCAGCLKTLQQDYEQFCLDLPEILHVTEFLREAISEGKLKLNSLGDSIRVTYHDPCHLSRALGVYDAPRDIIRSIPGVELVEMETVREAAMCCGAGGGLRSYDPDLSKKMAADRVRTAKETGVEIMTTACPFCENNLLAGVEIMDSKMKVVDVVDLVAQSLEK